MELCLARLRVWHPFLRIWGLSATLGNIEMAMETLLGSASKAGILVQGPLPKKIVINSVIPDKLDRFPRAGHLGIQLLPQVIERIQASRTSLVFTNTRSQAEIWYQAILEARPDWVGCLALHHGSLDKKTRTFVENALRPDRLRCVVCTSSLDLGIDFSPVDKVIQIGSPKGIARMMQRAGRSGHQPNQTSQITFVPTNVFELVELSALRRAVAEAFIEPRTPVELPLDVLCQHLVTLALGGGFLPESVFREVSMTHAFRNLSQEQFEWVLDFVTTGGPTLRAYAEYARVVRKKGRYIVDRQSIARRHRMTIGTITSDAAMAVKYLNGKRLGTIEESFVSRLHRGDIFVFAGKILRYERVKDMTLWARKVRHQTGAVPQWMGGRIPLSTKLGRAVRKELSLSLRGMLSAPEILEVKPVLDPQYRWSTIPSEDELLVEIIGTREGFHLLFYPFEGHRVHEGIAALLAYRISRRVPITLSMAVNDYGFERLSERKISLHTALLDNLLSVDNLMSDLVRSVNASEMAKRQFRDIARIAGLVFQGYPGSQKSTRQVQASTDLIFNVFNRYDPENLFLKQAMQEVLDWQLEHRRLEQALRRMARCDIRVMEPPHPTPLAFPIMVNRMRAGVSSEKLADKIRRMHTRLEKAAGSSDR
jgi:ATP-dependent Lhr-like helicase